MSDDETIARHEADLARVWQVVKAIATPLCLGIIGFYALGGGR